MNKEEELQEHRLRELLRAIPAPPSPDGLNDRIMGRVRQAGIRQERRAERNGLIWTIALSMLILGAGVWALYTYVDWGFLSDFWSERTVRMKIAEASGHSPEDYAGIVRRVLPLAGIVLFLLIGDSLLRRHFFLQKSGNDAKSGVYSDKTAIGRNRF